MNWSYLKTDVIGTYSSLIYGEQGDKIAIIGRLNEMIKVLHEKGHIFFIKEDIISQDFITKKQNNEQTIIKKSSKKRI